MRSNGQADRSTPVQVSNLSSVVAIASGDYHNLALKSDGTVWAWGDNSYGQLGDGSSDRSYLYSCSGAGSRFGDRDCCGTDHSLALKSDGTVWAWGSNDVRPTGRLEAGTINRLRNTPVQVQGLSSVVAIAAGGYHSLAVKSDGTVWPWGDNDSGQLGDGSTTTRYTPVQVQGLGSVSAIAAGYDA